MNKEGDSLYLQLNGRQRRPSDPQTLDETEPTSFNTNGACDVFKQIFKHLLANAIYFYNQDIEYMEKLKTEKFLHIKKDTYKQSQKKKKIVDALLHHVVMVFDKFRKYDMIQIIENDHYVINKILKLSVIDDTYFNIFEKVHEDILFIPDISSIVKLSLYPRIGKWFKDLLPGQFFEKKKILMLFGLMLSSHSKMNIYNVYDVAIKNNMLL